MKNKLLNQINIPFFVFLILTSCQSIASPNDEFILRRTLEIEAAKQMHKNVILSNINPATCKPIVDEKIITKNRILINSFGTLNFCPELTKAVVEKYNQEAAAFNDGGEISALNISLNQDSKLLENSSVKKNTPSIELLTTMTSKKVDNESEKLKNQETNREIVQSIKYYNKNKKYYASDSSDGLFEQISKAYIRSISKIFSNDLQK